MMLGVLRNDLNQANEAKHILLTELAELEARSLDMNANLSLEEEVENEKVRSEENEIKYQILEEELVRKTEEVLPLQNEISNGESQDEAGTHRCGSGKTCRMPEDHIIPQEATGVPGFFGGLPNRHNQHPRVSNGGCYGFRCRWRTLGAPFQPNLHFKKRWRYPAVSRKAIRQWEIAGFIIVTSTAVPASQTSSERNRNGFAKFFLRTKNGIQLEI